MGEVCTSWVNLYFKTLFQNFKALDPLLMYRSSIIDIEYVICYRVIIASIPSPFNSVLPDFYKHHYSHHWDSGSLLPHFPDLLFSSSYSHSLLWVPVKVDNLADCNIWVRGIMSLQDIVLTQFHQYYSLINWLQEFILLTYFQYGCRN